MRLCRQQLQTSHCLTPYNSIALVQASAYRKLPPQLQRHLLRLQLRDQHDCHTLPRRQSQQLQRQQL